LVIEALCAKEYFDETTPQDFFARVSGFFNQERTHQSLARQTPDEVYFSDRLRKAA